MSNDTILRKIKSKNYTVVDNGYLDNQKLSLKAKGLMTYLLRLPDDWHFNKVHLSKQSTDGMDSLESGLVELENAGHLIRKKQEKDDKGRFNRAEWMVYEITQNSKNVTETDFPVTGKPVAENPPLPSTKRISTKGTNMSCSVLGESKLSDQEEVVAKKNQRGETVEVSKSEIFDRAIRDGENWSLPEIEEAWQALQNYPNSVTDPYKYLKGTIRNIRDNKEKLEKLNRPNTYKPKQNGTSAWNTKSQHYPGKSKEKFTDETLKARRQKNWDDLKKKQS